MILLALGFFGGIALTVVAVVIPGRLLSVPESPADINDGDINDGDLNDGALNDASAPLPDAPLSDGRPDA